MGWTTGVWFPARPETPILATESRPAPGPTQCVPGGGVIPRGQRGWRSQKVRFQVLTAVKIHVAIFRVVVGYLAASITTRRHNLKMEVAVSSETLVSYHITTPHNLEDRYMNQKLVTTLYPDVQAFYQYNIWRNTYIAKIIKKGIATKYGNENIWMCHKHKIQTYLQ
jgi:hypothetical protein